MREGRKDILESALECWPWQFNLQDSDYHFFFNAKDTSLFFAGLVILNANFVQNFCRQNFLLLKFAYADCPNLKFTSYSSSQSFWLDNFFRNSLKVNLNVTG
jgi:hypothetical protein